MTKKIKLLVQGDYPLIASPTLAQAYGVASAIFLQKLHYCLQSDNAQLFQQKKFFYHSYDQWAETLGTYSPSTIKRIVAKLKKVGILIVKKLSRNKWIQTNFYSINYRKLSTLIKNSTESVEIESSEKKRTQSVIPSPKLVKKTAPDLKISALSQFKTQAKPNLTEGSSSPLAPTASSSILHAMSLEKRALYHQLLQLKIDIHYDDIRLDEWLKHKKYILRKAAYLKDQLGHIKTRWYSPEQLGLTVN